MKTKVISILLALGCACSGRAQTFQLTVNNGSGSGSFHPGDTVHVWSAALDSTRVFNSWTGDVSYLQNPAEWHSTLVMPAANIAITAQLRNVTLPPIQYEKIMGAAYLKNVYSCFPQGMKGLLYLLHGTGGSASNWTLFTEYRNLVNAALADSFGVLITEAEEITRNTDLNGDGKLRWLTFPLDTISGIDYLNIRALTDTFIARGKITAATPKFSLGMSNGGAFSGVLSYIYNFRAGISYCAPSAKPIFAVRNNPFAFRMALYDDNSEVGPQGNYDALENDSTLAAHGICHQYLMHDRQPIYAERFARVPGVSISASQTIFNELVAAQLLDANHYAKHSDTIQSYMLAHISQFPAMVPLSNTAKLDVINQIAASNAEHKFYSDYNAASIRFFKFLCSAPTGINEPVASLNVYPNPVATVLHISSGNNIRPLSGYAIYNAFGQLVLQGKTQELPVDISVQQLPAGWYQLRFENNGEVISRHSFLKE